MRENPVRVLNEVLLPAMKEVGDKFGAGELILPFVLQSAEVMKKAVKHLEQFLEKAEGYTKGKVVLATVYGDVHDIGKSLVNTILSNNGYTVFDLGKQVPVNTIIEKAVEVGADAIGLSALLVSTSKQMPLCVQELDKRGMQIPGAHRRRGDQPPLRPARAVRRGRARVRRRACSTARTRSRGWRRWTRSRIRAGATAFVAKHLDDARNDVFLRTQRRQGHRRRRRRRRSAATSRPTTPVPTPPFWGTRVLRDIPLDEVFDAARPRRALSPAVGRPRLGRRVRVDRARTSSSPRSSASKEDAKHERLAQAAGRVRLLPRAVAGQRRHHLRSAAYASDGGSLREIARFHFPRRKGASGSASPTTSASSSRATSTSSRSRS